MAVSPNLSSSSPDDMHINSTSDILLEIQYTDWQYTWLFAKTRNEVKLNKLHDLEFIKRLRSFEILCLQETQCGPKDTESLAIEGYHLFPFHRKMSRNGRFFGGSLLIVKNNMRSGVKIINNQIWIKLTKSFFNLKKDMYICFAYAPPLNSCYTERTEFDIFQSIEEDVSLYSNR